MSIFIETSQLQDDLLRKEQAVLGTIEFCHALAVVMNNGRTGFWDLPDDRLLAALNADVKTAVDTRTLFDNLATAVNTVLDEAVLDRPELGARYPTRAPLGYGRSDVVYNPIALEFQIET